VILVALPVCNACATRYGPRISWAVGLSPVILVALPVCNACAARCVPRISWAVGLLPVILVALPVCNASAALCAYVAGYVLPAVLCEPSSALRAWWSAQVMFASTTSVTAAASFLVVAACTACGDTRRSNDVSGGCVVRQQAPEYSACCCRCGCCGGYPQWYPAESAWRAILVRAMRCMTVRLAVSPFVGAAYRRGPLCWSAGSISIRRA